MAAVLYLKLEQDDYRNLFTERIPRRAVET